jgi:twitching motility protein PilT
MGNVLERKQEAASIPDQLRKWLSRAVQVGASDLHVLAGYPPVLRVHGELTELPDPPHSGVQTEELLSARCRPEVRNCLQAQKNVDFSFGLVINGRISRFRANVFHAGQQLGACLRVIPAVIPDFAWAGFPVDLARRMASVRDGLVIVTGAAGTGKSTALAMVINLLNQAAGYRIITIEEPVEYRFPRAANSVLSQREVGLDVLTFADGLKYGLRQDPDIILVGEVRDQDTAQMVLSAAETGHVVFTSLYTRDAKGAISRYADLFPQDAQREVRSLLAMS